MSINLLKLQLTFVHRGSNIVCDFDTVQEAAVISLHGPDTHTVRGNGLESQLTNLVLF